MARLKAMDTDKKISHLLNYVLLLNSFDCLLTLTGYQRGYIQEVNPMNALLLEFNPHIFIAFKYLAGIFLAFAFKLSGFRARKVKLWGGYLLVIVLGMIFFLHLYWVLVIFL